ncbi:hypothetical protein [Stakelama tenebrarum]
MKRRDLRAAEEPVEQVQRRDRILADQRIIDCLPRAPGGDNPVAPQQCELLRDGGIAHAAQFREFPYGTLAIAQQTQKNEPRAARDEFQKSRRAVDIGLQFFCHGRQSYSVNRIQATGYLTENERYFSAVTNPARFASPKPTLVREIAAIDPGYISR